MQAGGRFKAEPSAETADQALERLLAEHAAGQAKGAGYQAYNDC